MSFNTEALTKALTADLGRTKQPSESSSSAHWAAYALQRNLLKKYTDLNISRSAEDAAVLKFKHVNAQLLKWSPYQITAPVPSYQQMLSPAASYKWYEECRIADVFNRFKRLFEQQFYDVKGSATLDLAKAFNLGMFGPGASIGATADNLVDKAFNSRLTCTNPILFKFYRQALAGSKNWWKAERVRSLKHGDYRIVEGNNLFFVPKETVIARTAATEPSINMFGQLGYGKLIEDKLRQYHNIDLSLQPNINRWFAKSGSLNGIYATIDLSSASDTIGLAFIREYLPPKLVKDLELLRSPTTRIRGEQVTLNMISTMGNGYTFPLQTWIFANLVLSVMLESGEPIFDAYGKRRYSVFGDDIICPVNVFDRVVQVLELSGFTVNKTKSFAAGGFRESCGSDFFKGVDVRAVYLKQCTSDADVYGLINRLIDWTIRHKIALPNTIRYLSSLVQFRPIPQYEDERAGIRVPLSRLTSRKTSPNGNFYYHALVQRVESVKPDERTIEEFYHAFHVALLHGSFRKGRITPRVKPGCEVFKVIRREAHLSWDFVLDARLTSEERRNAFELHFPIRKV